MFNSRQRRALTVIGLSAVLVLAAGWWKIANSPHAVPVTVPKAPVPIAAHYAIHLQHLYLNPQHGAARLACKAMAARLGFGVPCPELLPTDAIISGVEWELAGIAYSVSLHGETAENRTAIELIARQLQLVQVN